MSKTQRTDSYGLRDNPKRRGKHGNAVDTLESDESVQQFKRQRSRDERKHRKHQLRQIMHDLDCDDFEEDYE